MKLSPISTDQFIKIIKAAGYCGVSAILDYLISVSTGTTFGLFTVPINVILVTIKQAFTDSIKE